MTQFPSTLHPHINSMLAKSYVLKRDHAGPLTVYDQNWQLVCLLCTTLPTIENGLAKRETTEAGEEGVAVTYTIHPDATWGDGTPVTSADAVFYLAGRTQRTVGLCRHRRIPPHPRCRSDRRQDRDLPMSTG